MLFFTNEIIEIKGLHSNKHVLGERFVFNPKNVSSCKTVVYEDIKSACTKINIYGIETVIPNDITNVIQAIEQSNLINS